MYRGLDKKIFHIIMIVIIIFAILCVAGILVLRYEVEGETNMPFEITKIYIVGSVEGNQVNGATEKWNLNVNQNNDIFIYIEKNPNYRKTEIIEEVQIKNITTNKQNEKGELKLYKPVLDEKRIFINSAENEITEITYKGDLETKVQEHKISNQGGKVAFRYGINNISQYISETDEQINHSQLLKLTNVTQEDLKTKLTFDLIIKLMSGKKYQTTINLDIPADEVIEEGTVGKEITELKDIVFKRIEN